MLLAVRISSYICAWEVWRALKNLELLSAAPRLIVEPNLETAESIVAGVAKNNCSGGELWLSPITVKGLNIRKPKPQLLQ